MPGLPWVAHAKAPLSVEGYLKDLDKRLVDQERQYEGRSRGSFSRFAVASFDALPVLPDGAAGLAVDEEQWYWRIGGAWLLYGRDRPPDPDWLQQFRERFNYPPVGGAWNTLKWPSVINPAPAVDFNIVAGVGKLERAAGSVGTVSSYRRVGIAPVRNFEIRVLFQFPAASSDYELHVVTRSNNPPAGYVTNIPYPSVVLRASNSPRVLRYDTAGALTDIGPLSDPPIATNVKQYLVARFDKRELSMKSWAAVDDEPDDWQLQYDPEMNVGDGVIWVGGKLATGATSPISLFEVAVSEL